MADDRTKQLVHDALKSTLFTSPDDLVDVSDGPDDSIHIVIVSRKFDAQRMRTKHDMVSDLLFANLPEEVWRRISLTICKSPEEIKASV
jgi:stress-induced morphogen